jgi:hypothetical protein
VTRPQRRTAVCSCGCLPSHRVASRLRPFLRARGMQRGRLSRCAGGSEWEKLRPSLAWLNSNHVATAFQSARLILFASPTPCHSQKSCPRLSGRSAYCAARAMRHRRARGQLATNSCRLALIFPIGRQFIVSNYPVIKEHNPDLPVLIREASGTPARVFARFGAYRLSLQHPSYPAVTTYNFTEAGVERKVELDNLSSSDVAAKIAQLLSIA